MQLDPELAEIALELKELLCLPDNWDSHGSGPVTATAVHTTLRLLAAYRWSRELPIPTVSPTSRGTVVLEWGGDEAGVEIECGADGSLNVLVDNSPGIGWEEHHLEVEDPRVQDALNWAIKLA